MAAYSAGLKIQENHTIQGRNRWKNLGATSAMVGRICPPGWDRVKVSENLGATAVAPVAPADTSLIQLSIIKVVYCMDLIDMLTMTTTSL